MGAFENIHPSLVNLLPTLWILIVDISVSIKSSSIYYFILLDTNAS